MVLFCYIEFLWNSKMVISIVCLFFSPWKCNNVSVQAQESYEKAMEKARKEHERSNVSPAVFPEYQLWEDHWIR